jgi:hypothetical protein
MSKIARIETHRTALVVARTEPELSLVRAAAPGERAQQLLAEARAVSLEHLAALQAALSVTRELAQEVVEAADLYGPGLEDFAGRLAEDLFWRGKTLEALAARQSEATGLKPRRRGS